jgi:TPR repeat protein
MRPLSRRTAFLLGRRLLTGLLTAGSPLGKRWKSGAPAPLAEQGDADAQYNLGNVYVTGEGVPKDGAEAAKWFRRLPIRDMPPHNITSASCSAAAGVCRRITPSLRSGTGSPPAKVTPMRQFNLGVMHAEAQFNLGVMYEHGDGVSQNFAEAVNWYRLAAGQGNANGRFNLGVMYRDCKGVPKNSAEAVVFKISGVPTRLARRHCDNATSGSRQGREDPGRSECDRSVAPNAPR